MGFFCIYGATAALATPRYGRELHLHRLPTRTHTRWQLFANDASGAPKLTDTGTSFAIATGGVLTLFIAASPNDSSVLVQVVDAVPGAVIEQAITAELETNTQFLSPRLYLNNGTTAEAVAYDCSGVNVEQISKCTIMDNKSPLAHCIERRCAER